jgi:hypothetical protein
MKVKGRLHVPVVLPIGEEVSGPQGRSGKETYLPQSGMECWQSRSWPNQGTQSRFRIPLINSVEVNSYLEERYENWIAGIRAVWRWLPSAKRLVLFWATSCEIRSESPPSPRTQPWPGSTLSHSQSLNLARHWTGWWGRKWITRKQTVRMCALHFECPPPSFWIPQTVPSHYGFRLKCRMHVSPL